MSRIHIKVNKASTLHFSNSFFISQHGEGIRVGSAEIGLGTIDINKLLYLDDKDVFAEMPIDTGIEPNFIGTKVEVPEKKEFEKGQFHMYNMVAGTDLVLNSFKTGCE